MKLNCSSLVKCVHGFWPRSFSDTWAGVLIQLVSKFVSSGSKKKHLTSTSDNRFFRSKECFSCTKFIVHSSW